ncbi:hypothetical protein AB1N83_003435 [Pleurotus pulmonarius]
MGSFRRVEFQYPRREHGDTQAPAGFAGVINNQEPPSNHAIINDCEKTRTSQTRDSYHVVEMMLARFYLRKKRNRLSCAI